MTSVLEQAKQHFAARLEEGLRRIDVPEWGCSIWFRPVMTMRQKAAISRAMDAPEGGVAACVLEALVQRALDAEGKVLFRAADRFELMRNVDADVIDRVVTEMSRGTIETTEDDARKP